MISLLSMERQKFLDELVGNKRKKIDFRSEIMRFLNWNIRNPSLRRATRQVDWLEKSGFDVIVLAEVKLSQGCVYIRDRLESLRYTVIFPKPEAKDYGVILAVGDSLKGVLDVSTNYLPYRTSSVVCNLYGRDILVTGVYVPVWRNNEKKKFLDEFEKLMSNEDLKKKCDIWIILGDLNVLEPNHIPSYPRYKPWEYFYNTFNRYGFIDAFRFFHLGETEYSWFGREGNGYRFDHIFISEGALPFLKNCFYLHEPRLKKLSDHCAMYLEIGSL